MKKYLLGLMSLVFMFGLASIISAEVNAVTPSTNDINRTKGWAHVNQISQGVGTTDLEFVSTRNFSSCFEYRADNESNTVVGANPNTNITDGRWTAVCVNNSTATHTISANEFVDVRMVYGAETDERFDWTRFNVTPAPEPKVKVTIAKYINGVPATTDNTNSASFSMTSNWSTTNLGSGSGNYNLSATGYNNPNPYQATTSDMNVGADYSTYENTGTSCLSPMMYALTGYSTGETLVEAEGSAVSTDVPTFTDLPSDKFVIVWNKTCVDLPVHLSPANNSVKTSAEQTLIDWSDVTNWTNSITYMYQSALSMDTNIDGSFTSPAYTSGVLAVSEIPTPGTPEGVYYWHVKAMDGASNDSGWTAPWKITINNILENIVVITKNTSMGENQPGWLFNRDLKTETPYEFNTDEKSIGLGSLYVKPIANNYMGENGNCKGGVDQTGCNKFIAENFLNQPIADVKSISYDFMIGEGGEVTDEEHFYMNVYANFGESADDKYYDCRYNVLPLSGSKTLFETVIFDPTVAPYSVATSGSSPHACPPTPAGMDILSPGSNIRAFAISLGDTSASDQGIDGYFDNVKVKINNVTTIYDFEKFVNIGEITNPTLNQEVSGTINLTATYDDNDDVNDDNVQWAVRKDSCSTNNVFGNVGGLSDSFTWDGKNFSSSLDTTTLDNGTYCFVFNPTDDAGQNDVRETVMFTIDNTAPVPPTEYGTLLVKKTVINNETGEMTAGDFSFMVSGMPDPYFFDQDPENELLGEKTINNVPVGTYTITENDTANYAEAGLNCTDVVVTAEQTTTCTFTNDDFVHSGGGSGPSSFSSGTGTVAGASTETPSETPTTETSTTPVEGKVLGETTCSAIYLNDFLAFGKKNNPEQVKLLQIFLNEELALSPALVVDGVFGESTKSAVIAFQEKYASEILTPWAPFGLSSGKGTGYVYKTTKWKINMIKCSDLKLVVPQLP